MSNLVALRSQQQSVQGLGTYVMNRGEAKLRLKLLTPGTEEYCQLQSALIKKIGIVHIEIPSVSYKVNTCSDDQILVGGFGSSEHVAIGRGVKLGGLPDNPALFMKGVTPVSFQQIVALAGDFYGVAGKAISLKGGSDEDKELRFIQAFETLEKAENDEVRRILLEIDDECQAVERSGLPHHCYSSQMIQKNNAIKKIKGDIDKLLIDNSDHFSNNARDAYRVGHALALKKAKEAGQARDLEGLKKAYALDAFACHFLTDLFAAGHIRNQRGDLELFLNKQLGFKKSLAKKLAGILTGAQHEKDGNDGLNVVNKAGDQWRAYGDGCFFEPKNEENKVKVIVAVQSSANEIFEAYNSPDVDLISRMDQLIPEASPLNPWPLYSVEGDSLFLYEGTEQKEVKDKMAYLKDGLAQALRYLPQNYIDGFIAGEIELPPLLGKVVFPQIERLTGTMWGMVGVAAHHQIKKETQKLNEKIDEMAGIVRTTYQNTVDILEKMKVFNAQLNQLVWENLFKEIKDSIGVIKNVFHEYKQYQLDGNRTLIAVEKLWEAHIAMSTVFCERTADEKVLLSAYTEMLRQNGMDENDVKKHVTLWFRQMLDYQVQAMSLYATLRISRGDDMEKDIHPLAIRFEKTILDQIENNKSFIDEKLIYTSQKYIRLQIEKSKVRQLGSRRLEASN
jgi:hypothetical protein